MTATSASPLARLQHWLEATPFTAFVLGVLLLGLVKTGIRVNPLPGTDAETFPQITNSWSATQFGFRGLVWLLGPNSELGFVLVGIAVISATVVLAAISFRRQFTSEGSRILLLIVFVGPIGGTLYTTIGQNDSLMILGSLIVAISNQRIGLVVLGLALMVAANPEQAIVAWLILGVMSLLPVLQRWRRTAAFGLVTTTIATAAIALVVRMNGAGDKSQFLDDYLLQSLHNFLSNFPLSIYALFGFSWPIVLWLIWTQGSKSGLIAAFALIPAFLVTAITIDQTRVLIGVTALATLTWLGVSVRQIDFDQPTFSPGYRLSWVFIFALILPSVVIYGPSGLPMGPYAWVFFALFGDAPLW